MGAEIKSLGSACVVILVVAASLLLFPFVWSHEKLGKVKAKVLPEAPKA